MSTASYMLEWKRLLTVRPNLIGGSGEIQISDALDQRRFKVKKRDLLDALASSEVSNCSALRALVGVGLLDDKWEEREELAGIEHWTSRNWTLALSYYLWSIRDEFLDEGEDYERIRCDALRQMLNDSPLPLPDLISPEEAVVLADPTPIPTSETCGTVLSKRSTALTVTSNGQMDTAMLHGLLLHGFSVSRRYHVPDIGDHIHNILHGVGFAFDPYLAIFDVVGLNPGIYYYSISQDRIRLVKSGDFRSSIAAGLIGHEQALSATCTILLTADFPRFQWRYRHERALRNLYFDVGRMAQYLILIATSFGVKTHITPATVDDALSELLSVCGNTRQVFHTITLGF